VRSTTRCWKRSSLALVGEPRLPRGILKLCPEQVHDLSLVCHRGVPELGDSPNTCFASHNQDLEAPPIGE
jgi:hypothetical protein